MKNKLLFILFLFWGVHAMSQNKIINLNERGKIEMKSTASYKKQNDPLKTVRTRAFTLSKTLQSNLNIKVKDILELDLFTDKKYKASVDKIEKDINGTLSIRARMVDYPMGYCIITTSSDGNSLVVIDIPELSEKYVSELDSQTKMSYLLELDRNQSNDFHCGEPLIPPAESGNTERNTLEKTNKQNTSSFSSKGVNDPAQIDIMVVYTSEAKKDRENSGGINKAIAAMMTISNMVLENSQAGITFNLVHSREINYTETGDSKKDIERLTDTSDGYMDEVHQWRNQYKADLVVLLEKKMDFGGRGWVSSSVGNPGYGFSVVNAGTLYAVSTIHEIGHNMGIGHHKQQKSYPGPGAFSYAAGWRWKGTDGKMYVDLMTYGDKSEFNDGIRSSGINQFSNPNINHAGAPTGHPTEGDGVRTLREMKHIVAAYNEKSIDDKAPKELSIINITPNKVQLNWNSINGALNYTVEYKEVTASRWNIAGLAIMVNNVTVNALKTKTNYIWRVRANYSSFSSDYTESLFTTLVSQNCANNFEPNETKEAAHLIEVNTTYSAGIGNSTDTDYYKFTLNAPSGIEVNFQNLPQEYTIYLYSSTSTIDYILFARTSETMIVNFLPAGTYYIHISGFGGNFDLTNCYDLTVTTTTATACTPTGLIATDITTNSVRLNWDVVDKAKSYTVEYKTSAASTWIKKEGIKVNYHEIKDLTAGINYVWKIKAICSPFSNSDSAESSFTTFLTLPTCVTKYESNENQETAHQIEINTVYSAGIGSDIDKDYYKFTLSALSNIKITLQNLPKDYDLHLYDSAGVQIATSTNGGTANEIINSIAMIPGTYYIYIYGYQGDFDMSQCYNLKVETTPTPACVFAYEDNEDFATAKSISLNIVHNATIGSDIDKDYYKFTLSALSDIVVTLQNLPKNYNLFLYDSERSMVSYSNKPGTANETITQEALSAGTYYLLIVGYDNFDLTQCYSLKVSATSTSVCNPSTGLNSDAITTNSANLKWDTVSGAQNYTIEYKPSTSSTWGIPIVVSTTTHSLQGLLANTTYDWRIETNCSGSRSSDYTYGTPFKTLATPVVCAVPTGLATSNLTTNSVNLNWTAVSGAQNYTIEYKTSATSVWSAPITVSSTNHPLGSLTANTTYNWRVKTNCSGSSSSGYTDGTSFKTLAATVVCNPPTVLPPANITSSTADLKWNVVSGAQSYTVEYKLSTASWASATTTTITNTSRSLLGLTADTTYDWRIKANCSGSSSSGYTDGTSFKTLAATVVCNPPTVLLPASITSSTADLKWNVVSGAQSYTVEYKLSTASWTSATTTTIATTNHPLSGLTANTTYNWRVKTNCSASSSSAYSDESSFKTLAPPVVCTVPTGLATSNLTTNSVNLNWTAVSGAQSYTVEYKLSTASWKPVTTSIATNSYTLSGLTAETTYNWRVKANCSGSSSSGYTDGTSSFKTYSTCISYLEPNQTFEEAKSISLNTVHRAAIGSISDMDYYKFTLSVPSDIVITLQKISNNYNLYLYDSLKKQINYSMNSGTADETITMYALAAGTYYVLPFGASGAFDTNQCYELKVAATTAIVCAAPTGLTTSDPTANSVKLNWTAVSGVQNYTIEYKTSATSTWSTPIPVTSTSYTLEGLTANMTYDWQVKANCTIGGSSEYINGTSFKTLTVCTPPTGLAITNITPSTADLKWNVVSGAQSYTVEYKLSTASWTSATTTTIATTNRSLLGLIADTTYDWRIKANCSGSSSSGYTDGTSFKTLAATVVCNPPTVLPPASITSSTADLKWNVVSGAQSYTVEYKLSTASWTSATPITIATTSRSLLGLTADTTYDWRIKANCSSSSSSGYTYGTSFKTLAATVVCNPPTVLPPASITSSTADLKWNVVIGAQSYTVEYKLSTASWTSATTTTIATTSRSLLGLTADTTYDWRIKANCSGSSSSGYTDGTSFKTLAATVVCNPPTVLPPASITSSTADLKWNVVSGAQSYTVEYKLSTASWTSATTTTIATTNRSLLGLIADTTYDWRIKANCSGSSSSGYTDGTSFKTLAATVVCNPPTVLPPANITSSTADLKWNVVSRAQSYTVEYKLSTASWTSATPITIATTSRSLLGLTADTTYDWRIKANCSGSSSSGYTDGTSFKTLAATVVCNVNAHEPNNYTRTATLIDLNKTYKAGIQKSTDKDYYKFFSGTFSNVVVTLKDLPQNYNLKLINSKGKQVGSLGNKTGTADETITANVLPQETYYVEVIGYNRAFDASQCYTLKVSTGTSTSCTAPTVFPPASITSSTADLKWNVVSGAQSYTVEYKLSTASWTSATTTTIANTSRSLLGLTADTTYDWRIKANCSGSSSSGYTDGTSFKTLAATVVCNPPTVLPPASITSSTADLKWNVVSGAQSYTVEYKLSTASWTSATPITIATTSRSLLGLTAETTYNWRVKTNCSASSSSGYTYGTSFKTLAATVVCNPPTVLPPANITSSTADLKWNVVSGAQSYTVEYKLSTASWTSAITTTITNTSRSLLGLTADTTYDWRIKANCSGSSSSGYTDGTSFKTLAATVVCNPPTVLLPASITSSTADLKWNVVSGAQSYTVEYKLSTASWTSATPITIATTSRSLLGLTADTTYDWRIKANCSGSSSSGYTYGTSFKTLAATVVCNPGLYEPNNTRKAASLIDLNTTYKAGIQVTLDRDYYKFILSAPSNVVITLENVPENYTFQLLNYLGSYIDSGFMSGNGKTIKRALARGTYYINITAFSRDYDASQCYALRINTPSGSSSPSSNETVVNDKNTILSSNVTLYPNPVDDMINIKGLVSDQEYTQLTIIDRNGGIVKTSQVKVEDIIRVDVSDLSPNIYHLTILGKNFRFIKK